MVNSLPPHGNFEASEKTKELRPRCALDEQQSKTARRMKRQGRTDQDISDYFNASIQDVQIALANLRTQTPMPRRKTLNIGTAAYRIVMDERLPGEPIWQTMDRILTELNERRYAA